MAIQKQEFYEGAALHQLIRGSAGVRIDHSPPLFIFDKQLQVHLKYSTGKRSPWGFTFTPDEQVLLSERSRVMPLVIGLICGADGIVALPYEDYSDVAPVRSAALRVACCRLHREHFEIRGPDGVLSGKIAPSDWARLLIKGEIDHERHDTHQRDLESAS
jgi:hypothetical protein